MGFGDRLPIHRVIPTRPIHKNSSICNQMMGEQMTSKTHNFSSTTPRG